MPSAYAVLRSRGGSPATPRMPSVPKSCLDNQCLLLKTLRSNLNSKLEMPSGQHQLWLTPQVLFPSGIKINKERDEYIGEERICSESVIRFGFTTTWTERAEWHRTAGQDS